jgi:molecular chaperone GrpE
MSDQNGDSIVESDNKDQTLIVEQEVETTPKPHSLGLELPADTAEANALLLREVAKSRDDAETYLNDLKRVAADFDNYRKRSMRESAAMLKRATEKVVTGLLPALDSFDGAIRAEPGGDSDRQLLTGVANTREQLLKSLENEGLEVIPTLEEVFDPEIHEPVGAPSGEGELVVTQELRRGYRLNGKVLRAALVVLDVK